MKRILLLHILCIFCHPFLFGQNELTKPFKECGVEGSITIYDYRTDKWICSDSTDTHKQTLPASTFKLLNTLIALETGVISSENEVVKWPGYADTITYGFRPDIYHDMSVREAFKVSAVWVYLELSRKIGKDNYAKYIRACNYGNMDLSSKGDFWNFGNLAISPAKQIELLLGLYNETLPFKKEYIRIVKDMMIEEGSESYTMRGKTGWTSKDGHDIGWWVGYLEQDEDVYFFATRLRKRTDEINPDFGRCRISVTKDILKQLNMLPKK